MIDINIAVRVTFYFCDNKSVLLHVFPLWARGPQRLGWGAELTHTATGEW